jgi:hypothetical protein
LNFIDNLSGLAEETSGWSGKNRVCSRAMSAGINSGVTHSWNNELGRGDRQRGLNNFPKACCRTDYLCAGYIRRNGMLPRGCTALSATKSGLAIKATPFPDFAAP